MNGLSARRGFLKAIAKGTAGCGCSNKAAQTAARASILVEGDEASLRAAIKQFPQYRDWLLQKYVIPFLVPPTPTGPLQSAYFGSAVDEALKGAACRANQGRPQMPFTCSRARGQALSVWVRDDPLVLCSSMPWTKPTESILPEIGSAEMEALCLLGAKFSSPMLTHLTNRAQQLNGSEYDDESLHTRVFSEVFDDGFRSTLHDIDDKIKAVFADSNSFRQATRRTSRYLTASSCTASTLRSMSSRRRGCSRSTRALTSRSMARGSTIISTGSSKRPYRSSASGCMQAIRRAERTPR